MSPVCEICPFISCVYIDTAVCLDEEEDREEDAEAENGIIVGHSFPPPPPSNKQIIAIAGV